MRSYRQEHLDIRIRALIQDSLTWKECSDETRIATPPGPLRCSFCGKTDSEVSKLIAGPGVHICDVCVGVCDRILEATPETFSGWDAMTNQQLLDALPPTVATAEATRGILPTEIDTLRNRGVSWAAIGTALGISRQAAWERFS